MNHRLQQTGRSAFTLIELLAVIAIIAVLASMILVGTAAVKKSAQKKTVKAELEKLTLFIGQYHSKKGFYPPGNQVAAWVAADDPRRWSHSQLFYELSGTVQTNLSSGRGFVTLNGSYTIAATGPNSVMSVFGVPGFMNSSQAGGGSAQPFLVDVKQSMLRNVGSIAAPVHVLAVPVRGPDDFTDADGESANLWNYNPSSPTNNPNSYDLWADILLGGDVFRVSNWAEDPVKL